jgi:hypothetical protein
MAAVVELSNDRLLTRAVSQFIFLSLYSILQVFGFTTGLLDARLHLVGGDVVRHVGGLWERQLIVELKRRSRSR